MASSSSTSSDSDSESSLKQTFKRKRDHVDAEVDSDSDSDNSDSESSQSDTTPHPGPSSGKHTRAVLKSKSAADDEDDEDEEPVLSHAAKRKEKKKQQKTEEQKTSPTKSSSRKAKFCPDDATSTVLPKRQNSVWVGNLSFKTTESGLRTFFEGVGEITRVHMPVKSGTNRDTGMRGENMGFAYVDFSTPDAKTVAIALSEGNLDGRRLLIKDGSDYAGRPAATATTTGDAKTPGTGLTKTQQRILRSQKQPAAPTLFLGNLSFETTQDSIREFIEAHWKSSQKKKGKKKEGDEDEKDGGKEEEEDKEKEKGKKGAGIRKIRLGTFEDSGNCKGWAFVDFVDIPSATAVLLDSRNHHLDGRDLKVEYASPDAVRRGGGVVPGAAAGANGPPKKRRKFDSEGEQREYGRQQQRGHTANDMARTKKFFQDEVSEEKPFQKSEKTARPTKTWSDRPPRRSKPGAALALAPREQVSIVPSQGQKIRFD